MRALRVAGAAVVAAFALAIAGALPASAHDELVGSNPENGQRLDAVPVEVSLDFSADVMTMGAAVVVADQSGKDWVASEPAVDQGTVTVQLLPDMPVAGYEIRWRVVSSDGHPISGVIPFTVGDAQPLVRESASAEPNAESPAAQGETENEGAVRALIVGGSAAFVAAVAFITISSVRRRRVGATERTDVPLDN